MSLQLVTLADVAADFLVVRVCAWLRAQLPPAAMLTRLRSPDALEELSSILPDDCRVEAELRREDGALLLVIAAQVCSWHAVRIVRVRSLGEDDD